LTYEKLGLPSEATVFYNLALLNVRALGDRPWEAALLTKIADLLLAANQQAQAASVFNELLPIQQEINDRTGEAATWAVVAKLLAQMDNSPEAIKSLQMAIDILRDSDLPHDAAGDTLADYELFLHQLQGDE
jgi:tetratricopeptide (TPR) repeat protein